MRYYRLILAFLAAFVAAPALANERADLFLEYAESLDEELIAALERQDYVGYDKILDRLYAFEFPRPKAQWRRLIRPLKSRCDSEMARAKFTQVNDKVLSVVLEGLFKGKVGLTKRCTFSDPPATMYTLSLSRPDYVCSTLHGILTYRSGVKARLYSSGRELTEYWRAKGRTLVLSCSELDQKATVGVLETEGE